MKASLWSDSYRRLLNLRVAVWSASALVAACWLCHGDFRSCQQGNMSLMELSNVGVTLRQL
jgi:hypothetical protein